MKKFKYSFILVFILLLTLKDLTYAQGDIGVGNLRNFYTKHDYIDLKGVTDKTYLLQINSNFQQVPMI